MSESAVLRLSYPESLAADFPRELGAAEQAVARVLPQLNVNLASLARHSPALSHHEWETYLRCSIARMVHMAAALNRRGVSSGRLLDYGSYFGNFSSMFAAAGYQVDAIDGYRDYGEAFTGIRQLLADAGVTVLDFDQVGRDLHGLPAGGYDVVLCLGVIEHVPHTPRLLLQSLDRVLAPGGLLLIDTPNHAYIYHRLRLSRGESVMADIAAQFHADPPFEGHHREYTASELVWMLGQIGHGDIAVESYNYSVYGLSALTGEDLVNYWATALDPSGRELVMTASRKGTAAARIEDWRQLYLETEPHWVASIPEGIRAQLRTSTPESLGRVKLEEYFTAEIARRDRENAALHERIGELTRERDRRITARVSRLWRRLAGARDTT
jgi:2-polyprenyl-3-methyl-5-hydroxy-6-metoxy-1,4-benzoquinol methylase